MNKQIYKAKIDKLFLVSTLIIDVIALLMFVLILAFPGSRICWPIGLLAFLFAIFFTLYVLTLGYTLENDHLVVLLFGFIKVKIPYAKIVRCEKANNSYISFSNAKDKIAIATFIKDKPYKKSDYLYLSFVSGQFFTALLDSTLLSRNENSEGVITPHKEPGESTRMRDPLEFEAKNKSKKEKKPLPYDDSEEVPSIVEENMDDNQ